MKPRKPRANLHQLRSLAAHLRSAQYALDLAMEDAATAGTPWRVIADAVGMPATSVRRRFSAPGMQRHRWWPKEPRELE